MTEQDPSVPTPPSVLPTWARVIALTGADQVVHYRLYFSEQLELPVLEARALRFLWEMRGGKGQAQGLIHLTGASARALARLTPTQRWIVLEEVLQRKYMPPSETLFPPSGTVYLTLKDLDPRKRSKGPRGHRLLALLPLLTARAMFL